MAKKNSDWFWIMPHEKLEVTEEQLEREDVKYPEISIVDNGECEDINRSSKPKKERLSKWDIFAGDRLKGPGDFIMTIFKNPETGDVEYIVKAKLSMVKGIAT